MSLFVNTNVSSLNAQRQVFNVSNSLSTSFERLSSGFRINGASDDAAGLQITERMTSQIQGLDQAARNANDAISLTQTAEGALDESTTALQRIRTLAIQAQNGINSAEDRAALSSEITALKQEVSRIASYTEFAGLSILKGNFSAQFLVGANQGQTVTVEIGDTANSFGAAGLGVTGTVDTDGNADTLLGQVDDALSKIGTVRSDLGALQNRFQSTIRNLSNISENVSAARSQIRDTDFATETASLTRNQIMQQASTTVLAQANQRPQAALSLLG
ncbi:flagellin [Alteromonas mediterranea]|jgi:flagellin|uniref:flagellin N-terminal helical domain-containing protein n=1 Tax=Alteromonas mediterranea TaxID=314275 RepID=UPI0002988B41|nr:flagellin [Alteromonas mediterranea]AFV84543.1 flagellin-like protein [Alteromonas mediterranea DE1]AGP96551.1 flagellin-like protein [Alteromonas mediterranea UM7]